jgi:hypothetical protein
VLQGEQAQRRERGYESQTGVYYFVYPAILQSMFYDGYCYLEYDFTPLLAACEAATYA